MFRTRDFILLFVTIVFLLVAISATVLNNESSTATARDVLEFAETSDENIAAEYYSPETLSREERLIDMRRKIAEGSDLMISTPEIVVDLELVVDEDILDSLISKSPKYCPGDVVYAGQWPVGDIKYEQTEGALVFYTEAEEIVELSRATTSSSTEPIFETLYVKNNLLQLPVTPVLSISSHCLPTDVVGVALDGSLIRNNETSLYGLFGSGTLVGYALDGFPIYGVSSAETDVCGGTVLNGAYGYYLSEDRNTILNCYSAVPQEF
jgi:hypothetical protein